MGLPIAVGTAWPSRDGVHTFKCERFEAPADWPLAETRLVLDAGGESLLTIDYDSGARLPLGLDVNHFEFPLDERGGALEIESVARGPFWTPVTQPRLARAELAWIETGLDDFVRTLTLTIDLAAELAVGSEPHEAFWPLLDLAENAMARLAWPTATAAVVARQSRYAAGYERAMDGNPFAPVPLPEASRASVAETLEWLRGELRALQKRFPPQGAVALMGHAHIDTAWLWPIEETRRKVRRTFATATDLLRRYPNFRHVQSFAEYYRQLEDDDPALLEAVKAEVAAGRWEPVGGLWVEPDINMPCGESLTRQALYGQLYFERTFGQRHTAAWLPDTFGFTPALPQILMGTGLTSLYTVKIGWSETNRFPHTRFWWQGIDGSRLLVHHMIHPEDNYNGQVTPRALLRVWRNNADKQAASETIYPIGFGDGGGGPTAEMIAAQAALADFPLVPATRFAAVADYYAKARQEAASGKRIETWAGELYLEYHRGVLTSQARTKRLHRQAEQALVGAEFLSCAAHVLGAPAPASLEPHWRTLMINQFHDILPGSSISEVYARTEPELAAVVTAAEAIAGTSPWRIWPGGSAAALSRMASSRRCWWSTRMPRRAYGRLRLVSSPTPIPGGQAAEKSGYVLAGRRHDRRTDVGQQSSATDAGPRN